MPGPQALGPASPAPGTPFPHPPAPVLQALSALVAADPALAPIEGHAGPLPWRTRPPGFPGLLQAITAQMISNQAARAIWSRVAALPGATSANGLLALPPTALLAAGFSRPKVAHARNLALAYVEGRLVDDTLENLADAEAIAALTALPGLGPWTAEVYLLFALGRLDVFPAGDVALQAAAAEILDLPARPDPKSLRALADRWRPHRALAARLLWHHWRWRTRRPSFDDV